MALTHGGGCAINTKAEGYLMLIRTLQGYARHPNFGGILMIGLGCETNQIGPILEHFKLEEGKRLRTMTIQHLGGTRKTIEAASEMIRDMLPEVECCNAHAAEARRPQGRARMWRLRRLFRHFGQPSPRPCLGSHRAKRRNVGACRNA